MKSPVANEVTLALAITHTPWVPERVESHTRLVAQLSRRDQAENAASAQIFGEKAPNWIWSEEQWIWGTEQEASHCLFLQDDVFVAINFWTVLKAMLAAVPDQVISLYNGHPGAKTVARDGQRWFTTADGLVGMGYVFPKVLLQEFLDWRAHALKPRAVEHITEDTLIDFWAVDTGRKIWHPVPTILDHDLSITSTYGNDEHPYRRPAVTWKDADVCGWAPDDLESLDFWDVGGDRFDREPPHFGRFYRGSHWYMKKWCKEFNMDRFRQAELDVCPAPYNKFFVYP